MKIRNGFVSNSSSSSFIVAFPNKPTSEKDVLEYMFNGKDGGISVFDGDGLSYNQISAIIFKDIKDPVDIDVISDMLSGRYHYSPESSNCFWTGKVTDKDGGAWSNKYNEKWYGIDKKTMGELKQLTIANHNKEKEFNRREGEILSKGPKPVPYAYEGGNNYDKKAPYTKEEIKKYNRYIEDMEDYKKDSKEFKELEKEKDLYWKDKYDKEHELRDKIAQKDAETFISDNKDKRFFIFEYEDHSNEGVVMEQGNIFRNVPYIEINNH